MPVMSDFTEVFRERGVYFWVRDGDGTPVANAWVVFKTSAELGYTNTTGVTQRKILVETNEFGWFYRTLWCDEDSNVAIDWAVHLPKENGETVETVETRAGKSFSLAYVNGVDVALGDLLKLSTPMPTNTTLLYQAIEQYVGELVGNIGGTVDQSIIDGSGNAVSSNAVFDAMAIVSNAIADFDFLISGGGATAVYTNQQIIDGGTA